MKNLVLLFAIALFTATAASAAEPLLLEPLSPTVLSTTPGVGTSSPSVNANNANNGIEVSVPGKEGVYEATFTPANKLDSNMVPQNAAAEGKPVPEKEEPRVRVQTKQRSNGNAYWNAGGKGTKSFF